MRSLFVAAVLLASSVASAKPCKVDIVRAPDDVREAIESRAGRHLRCAELSVRVVTQDDGMLYAIAVATDRSIREQVFRDATEAATAIVQWAIDIGRPRAAGTTADVGRDRRPVGTDGERRSMPAGETDRRSSADEDPAAVHATNIAPHRGLARWLSLTGLVGPQGFGVRGELDVFEGAHWVVGLAAGASQSTLDYVAAPTTSELTIGDLRGVLTLARAVPINHWQLRARGGVGVIQSSLSGLDTRDEPMTGSVTTPIFELSLHAARELGDSWALGAGVLFTAYSQDFSFGTMTVTRDVDTVAVATLHRAL